jgi:hypothetical protein
MNPVPPLLNIYPVLHVPHSGQQAVLYVVHHLLMHDKSVTSASAVAVTKELTCNITPTTAQSVATVAVAVAQQLPV